MQLSLSKTNQVNNIYFLSKYASWRKHNDYFIFPIWCRQNYDHKKIQQKYQSFKISVSHTTRSPRSNEVEGVDYYFVSNKNFEKLIKEKFYEYAKIFDNFYGTLKKNVDEIIQYNDLIFDIDWQGTKQLSKFKNLKLIKIYLITSNKNGILKKDLLKGTRTLMKK